MSSNPPQVRNKPMPVKREAEGEAGMASRELERYCPQNFTLTKYSPQINPKIFGNSIIGLAD